MPGRLLVFNTFIYLRFSILRAGRCPEQIREYLGESACGT
jgi:hypothetical protein